MKAGLSESKTAERASITSSQGNTLNQTVRDSNEGLDGPGGGYKCQLSVKILAICQLSVKFKAIC